MSELLISIILATCPGFDLDKGQTITNQCQDEITNCAVDKKGNVTEESIKECLKIYMGKHENQFSDRN